MLGKDYLVAVNGELNTDPFTDSLPSRVPFAVLPERPIILDRFGVQLNGTSIGPVEEGDDMTLVCRVVGGKWAGEERGSGRVRL